MKNSRIAALMAVVALTLVCGGSAAGQGASKTLVAIFAHADDEGAAAPILAARVHVSI